MKRKDFIIHISASALMIYLNGHDSMQSDKLVFGHNGKKYTWDDRWSSNSNIKPPVNDCHEMVFTDDKELILLTNDVRNNLIYFNKKGHVIRSSGTSFPGAHGLTIHGEVDQTLFITDTELHQFYETTLDGTIIRTWDYPKESGKYNSAEEFVPTETAITSDGEIYVADGYGAQYILHYDRQGILKNIFGGRGEGDKHLDNAHGICIDHRGDTPLLIVTDRNRCSFKYYDLQGNYLNKIVIPGANICRPVIKGDYLYAAVLTTDHTGNSNTGFVLVLDKENKVVSALAGSTPADQERMYQTVQLFKHPHDVCIDDEDNLYVCQWNSGQIYPYKFSPHV